MKNKFFAVFLVGISLFLFNPALVRSETLTYSFNSITIISAYHFDVLCDIDPEETSYLYGHVNLGETIHIYAGVLNLESDENTSESRIIIVSNEMDEDICEWLVNSMNSDGALNITHSYSSHIQIDPAVGVVKNLDNPIKTAIISTDGSNYSFYVDNTSSHQFNMIPNTFEEETDLNIVISVYGGI